MTDQPQFRADAPASPRIGLASASPRRHELIAGLGLEPVVLSVDVDETRRADEPVLDYVSRLALEKARRGADIAPTMPVVGGDTIVCLGERAFGKPHDDEDARRMLSALSGRTHEVHSAVALLAGGIERVRVATSQVTFAPLSAEMIDHYVATGEPADKAGAYGIQGLAACFIAHLSGSYSAVMGLPLHEMSELLREAGIDVLAQTAGEARQ